MDYLIPILIATIGIFATLLNLFLSFLLYVIWGEIKNLQSKQSHDLDVVYDTMREDRSEMESRINHIDHSLHTIKTDVSNLGLKLEAIANE